MATTRKTTSTRSKAATKAVTEPATEEQVPISETKEPVKIVPKEVDMHQYVTVRNGAHGKLIYISPRTGERFVWEGFGDAQEMELQELRNAKAANKKFFERNWFMFDDEFSWVIDFLGVGAFYKNALSIDNFDDIFQKTPKELTALLNSLNDGQKKSVAYRAQQLIAEGGIDSMRVITALEKGLGVELVER